MRRFCVLLLVLWLVACLPAPAGRDLSPGVITVTLAADGGSRELSLPVGAAVREALQAAGITLGEKDRVTPGETTPLVAGAQIRVVRVREKLEIEQTVLPFERQTVVNEGLAAEKRLLLQSGVNGAQEITYRIVYEDGVEVSRSPIKSTITAYPIKEIVMIGSQTPFTAIAIEGTLVYLAAGNAGMMRANSGARRPLTTTGSLDGRAFSLSPDSKWLLYTAAISGTQTSGDINQLWVVPTGQTETKPIDLRARNIVHFAGFSPVPASQPAGGVTLAYSTAEPRAASPGWQANNDLRLLTLDSRGRVVRTEEILGNSPGGLYGWWGTQFAWAPDGTAIAYARADGLGVVALKGKKESPLFSFVPFQTFADWAWVPSLAWAPGGLHLYTVEHSAPAGQQSPETSPTFNLIALSTVAAAPASPLMPLAGMFALPSPSPVRQAPGDERAFLLAYLQADDPLHSVESRYRLWVMDRDGSNARALFPPENQPGLEISGQHLAWSPSGKQIALIYGGNLWVIDAATGAAQQLTGDGQTSEPRWGNVVRSP